MTRMVALAAVASLAATWAAAQEVAPTDVVFEDGAIATSLSGAPGNPAEGARIMTTRRAGQLRGLPYDRGNAGRAVPGTIAPMLDGVADRWSEAALRGLVANAKMTFEGTFMPAFDKTEGFIRPGDGYTGKAPEGDLPPILSAQQIEDVVSYLLTLKE